MAHVPGKAFGGVQGLSVNQMWFHSTECTGTGQCRYTKLLWQFLDFGMNQGAKTMIL
jgi:hypothetical protein